MAKKKPFHRSGNPQTREQTGKPWSWKRSVDLFTSLLYTLERGAHEPIYRDSTESAIARLRDEGVSEVDALRRTAAANGIDPDAISTSDELIETLQERELHHLQSAQLTVPTPQASASLMHQARHLSLDEANEMWDTYKPDRPGAVMLQPEKFRRAGELSSLLITWSAAHDEMPAVNERGDVLRVPGARVMLYADYRSVREDLKNAVSNHLRVSHGNPSELKMLIQRDLLYTYSLSRDVDWKRSTEERMRELAQISGRAHDEPLPDYVEEQLPRIVAALALRSMAKDPASFITKEIPHARRISLDRHGFDGEVSLVHEWPAQPVTALNPDTHHTPEWSSAAAADRHLHETIKQMEAYSASEAGRAAAVAYAGMDAYVAEGWLRATALDRGETGPELRDRISKQLQQLLGVRDLPPDAKPQQLARAHINGEPDRWQRFNNPLFDAHTWVIDPDTTRRVAASAEQRQGAGFDLDALPSAIGLLHMGEPLITTDVPRHSHVLKDAAPITRAIDTIGWEVVEGADPPALRLTAYERAADTDASARQETTDRLLGVTGAQTPPWNVAYRELLEFGPEGVQRTRMEDGTLITALIGGYPSDEVNVDGVPLPGGGGVSAFVGAFARELSRKRLGVHRTLASGEPTMDRGHYRRGSAKVLSYDPESIFQKEGPKRPFKRRTELWLHGTALKESGELHQSAHLRGHPDAVAQFTHLDGSHDLDGFADWYEEQFGYDLRADYDEQWRPRGRQRRTSHAVTSLRDVLDPLSGAVSQGSGVREQPGPAAERVKTPSAPEPEALHDLPSGPSGGVSRESQAPERP